MRRQAQLRSYGETAYFMSLLAAAFLLLACRFEGRLAGEEQKSPRSSLESTGSAADKVESPDTAPDTVGVGSQTIAHDPITHDTIAQDTIAQDPIPSSATTGDSGVLTGVILLRTADGLKPVADIKIALGETLRDDEGAERVVAYEPSTAPVAYTDSGGRFFFEELQSGRYGLILDTVLTAFLLHREGTANVILLDIFAGEVTDLGRLEYSELPLPQSSR